MIISGVNVSSKNVEGIDTGKSGDVIIPVSDSVVSEKESMPRGRNLPPEAPFVVICLILALLAAWRYMFGPITPEKKGISILTHNILCPQWTGKLEYPCVALRGARKNYLDIEFRRPKILKTIRSSDADLVCLQGVERPELDLLLNRHELGETYDHFYCPHTDQLWAEWCRGGEDLVEHGNAFLVKKHLMKKYAPKFHKLKLSSDGNHAAILMLGDCAIVNVHLAHMNDSSAKDISSCKQFQVIEKWLESSEATKTVFLGDFNCYYLDELYQDITKRAGFKDLTDHTEDRYTFTTNILDQGVEPLCYIMTKGDITTSEFGLHMPENVHREEWEQKMVRNPSPRWHFLEQTLSAVGSDHLPLYAELDVKLD